MRDSALEQLSRKHHRTLRQTFKRSIATAHGAPSEFSGLGLHGGSQQLP